MGVQEQEVPAFAADLTVECRSLVPTPQTRLPTLMIPISLSALPLPPSMLSSLTKAGYETLQDVQNISPEDLSEGLFMGDSPFYALSSHDTC